MSSTVPSQQPVLTDAQVDALCAQSADRMEGLETRILTSLGVADPYAR